ncbi:MAG: FHA domain-containing protein [Myxococcota bacterium]
MGVRFVVRARGVPGVPERTYEFDQGRVVVGRGQAADIRLPHRSVSHVHAVVRQQDVGYVLVDEGATNGTRVNGQMVVAGRPKPLRNGDRITVGVFELELGIGVAVADATGADRTAALARQLVRELWAGGGDAPTRPRLSVVEGPDAGAVVELPDPPSEHVVGRGADCALVLSDADVSREHLVVRQDDAGTVVEDLGSKNGILVNERPTRRRRLRDRDEIALGATVVAYEDPAEALLRGLDGEPDEALEEPAPDEPGAQEATGTEPPPGSEDAGDAGTPAAARKKRGADGTGADLIVYLMAGSVFLLSLAALFFLLGG